MKQNQHQAGGKNNRRRQSKQARASTSKSTPETTTPEPHPVWGADGKGRELLVSQTNPEEFHLCGSLPGATAHPLTRAEAVAWFTRNFMPEELRAQYAQSQPGDPTTQSTPETASPALRSVFGCDQDDQELLVSESGPEQFYIRQQGVEGEPVRPITRAEAVAWFTASFVPDELRAHFPEPQPGDPALPVLQPAHVDRLCETQRKLENTANMLDGFTFLLTSHLEKPSMSGGVTGVQPGGTTCSGLVLLGNFLNHELAECQSDLHHLKNELGGSDLARRRLAQMDAAQAQGGAK